MTLSEIAATLTGERMLTKPTDDGRAHPSPDEIARLAYHLYEFRGRRDGHDVDDWLFAERELAHHYQDASTTDALGVSRVMGLSTT